MNDYLKKHNYFISNVSAKLTKHHRHIKVMSKRVEYIPHKRVFEGVFPISEPKQINQIHHMLYGNRSVFDLGDYISRKEPLKYTKHGLKVRFCTRHSIILWILQVTWIILGFLFAVCRIAYKAFKSADPKESQVSPADEQPLERATKKAA